MRCPFTTNAWYNSSIFRNLKTFQILDDQDNTRNSADHDRSAGKVYCSITLNGKSQTDCTIPVPFTFVVVSRVWPLSLVLNKTLVNKLCFPKYSRIYSIAPFEPITCLNSPKVIFSASCLKYHCLGTPFVQLTNTLM